MTRGRHAAPSGRSAMRVESDAEASSALAGEKDARPPHETTRGDGDGDGGAADAGDGIGTTA